MQKPVIFLAFANDKVDYALYLRNLVDEQNEISKILEKKSIEKKLLMPFNKADFLKDFAEQGNDFRVFHYGGHGGKDTLFFEDFDSNTKINAQYLMNYLANFNLKLIFLNACDTYEIGEKYRNTISQRNGISCVICTKGKIDDDIAIEFAKTFYLHLANGNTIGKAFEATKNAQKLTDLKSKSPNDWHLLGTEEGKNWKLEEIDDDPEDDPISYDYSRKPFIFQPENQFYRFIWRWSFGRLDFKKSYYKALERIENDSRFEWKIRIDREDREHIVNIFKKYVPLHTATGNLKYGAKSFKQEKGKKPDLCNILLKYMDLSPKIVLLLGESGMGKTMILQKTFVELAKKYPEYPMAFVYCGADTDAQIDSILEICQNKNIILFIDAFDEDLKARRGDYKARYHEIIGKVAACRKIYISAREHLFEHDQDVPKISTPNGTALGFERIVISKMNNGQIEIFLDKFFGKEFIIENGQKVLKVKKATDIVNGKDKKKDKSKKEDVHPLYYRPLILSNLEFLFEESEQANYHFTYQVYAQILKKWAERELPIFFPNQTLNDRQIAWKINRILVASKNLAKHLFGQEKQAQQEKPILGVKASELPQVVRLTEPKRSFVKREGELYSFAHQAFYDYFLAVMLFKKQIPEEEFRKHIKTSKESLNLYQEMLIHQILGEKKKTFDLEGYIDGYEKNISELLTVSNNLYIRALLKKYADRGKLDGFTEQEYPFKIIPFLENICSEKHYVFGEYKKYELVCLFLLKNVKNFDLAILEPSQIEELKNLQELHLIHNELTSLPEEIKELQNLQTLGLGGNELISLPKGIKELQNLQTLTLANCPNLNLVDTFLKLSELQNLQSLGLAFNQLTRLPKEIKKLQSLQMLTLVNNPNLDLVDTFLKLSELQNLQTLGLISNEFINLPKGIKELKSLQTLFLSGNQLKSLPEEIKELKNLQRLYLWRNNFSKEEQEKIRQLLPNCKVEF